MVDISKLERARGKEIKDDIISVQGRSRKEIEVDLVIKIVISSTDFDPSISSINLTQRKWSCPGISFLVLHFSSPKTDSLAHV